MYKFQKILHDRIIKWKNVKWWNETTCKLFFSALEGSTGAGQKWQTLLQYILLFNFHSDRQTMTAIFVVKLHILHVQYCCLSLECHSMLLWCPCSSDGTAGCPGLPVCQPCVSQHHHQRSICSACFWIWGRFHQVSLTHTHTHTLKGC